MKFLSPVEIILPVITDMISFLEVSYRRISISGSILSKVVRHYIFVALFSFYLTASCFLTTDTMTALCKEFIH
jgi:type IV secretory pathway TrbL component